jgi:hypothetical protein
MGTDGYGIYGPLAFYDHRSGGLLKPDADTYYPLYDAEKCILCGYAIYGDTGKAAIMSLYGEVLSDFVYSAKIGGDGIITWETRNGFAVVADSDAETQKFGAADLRSGGAAIAPVYDEISLYEDFAIGTLDGVYYILSYQGETLLTSNTPPVNGAYGGYDLPPGPTPTSQFFTADSGNTLIYLESSYELPAAAEDMLKYTQQTAETLGGQYDDVDVSFSYYAAATKGETIDIYFQNPGGPALIMENVYGYVWDLNSLYGVLVYKDAVTCGFLDSGGQFNEIPIDFSVESRFLEYYW